MATSAPAWARARAEARPRRRAAPVMRQVLPRRGLSGSLSLRSVCMAEFYLFSFLHNFPVESAVEGRLQSGRARVPAGRGLFTQGLSPLRAGEGESHEALAPRRLHL